MNFKRIEKNKDLDLLELRKIVATSLEMSLEKLTLTIQDHRYHQGIVQVLKDLDKLIQTP